MKTLLVFSLFFVAIYGQGLIETLKRNGFKEYAYQLQSNPDILARFTEGNDVTVFAPIDKKKGHHGSSYKSRLRVRQLTGAEVSVQGSTTGPPPEPAPQRKRDGYSLPPSNFLTLRTFLRDPNFVNLGKDQPGRVVSNYAGDSDVASLQVTSGTGKPVNQVSGPFKYDRGIIVGVEEYFTLPKPLIESLEEVGLKQFRDEIVAQGFEKKLSKTPGVTIFAPSDHTYKKIDVAKHVITNGFLGFLPELYDQSGVKNPIKTDGGIPIRVKLEDDGSFTVNGVRIIRANIIVKNGVVHEIEKPLH